MTKDPRTKGADAGIFRTCLLNTTGLDTLQQDCGALAGNNTIGYSMGKNEGYYVEHNRRKTEQQPSTVIQEPCHPLLLLISDPARPTSENSPNNFLRELQNLLPTHKLNKHNSEKPTASLPKPSPPSL